MSRHSSLSLRARNRLATLAPSACFASVVVAAACIGGGVGADIPRWDNMPLGATYQCGDTIYPNGVLTKFYPIIDCNGWSGCNFAQVVQGGAPCNVDQRLGLNNIAVSFEFAAYSGPEDNLLMTFGQFGGFMNISINGSPRICFTQMGQLDGQTLGGVTMQVTNGFGNGCGAVAFFGTVDSLVLAGQEFWIDGICAPQPRDIDGSGDVGAADLAYLLGAWGTNVEYADFNCDEKVDAADLSILLGDWG
ncbi:MAG: hypothetical protein ACKO3W_13405 [bacterium]